MDANALLDRLPRATFGRYTRPVPAFRTCGIVGFYAAVVLTIGGGLLNGSPPLLIAVVCLVAGLSFFAWAFLRRAATRRESYVLLEHVWFAEAAVCAVLYALGEPILPALDAMSVGLCGFLACGRIGCLLAGCCHGRPSAIGIRYGEASVRDGFPAELEGVRLLPVPLLEAAGLVVIGIAGLAALSSATPGIVFAWFLIGYSILRFGLEGLRGDERPHVFGLSINRWMCIAEFTLALLLAEHELNGIDLRDVCLTATLIATLAASLALRRRSDNRRRLLAREHLDELRSLADALVVSPADAETPVSRRSSLGVALAVSRVEGTLPLAHASLSQNRSRPDVKLLCDLAAEAFPAIVPDATRLADTGVLHLVVALGIPSPAGGDRGSVARLAYRATVLSLAEAAPEPAPDTAPEPAGSNPSPAREAYFAAAGAP